MRKLQHALLTALMVSAAAIPAAHAQEAGAESGGLGEIIVTATRRAESLQDVPMSIAAVTGDQLGSAGVSTTRGLEQVVPGLVMGTVATSTQPTLRGIGTRGSAAGDESNIAMYLDGVYQPSSEHIEATLDETRLLARLVEDLRVLSLAEAGHLPMLMEPVDVGELLEDAATSFSGQAEAAGVRLAVELPDSRDDLIVTGDAGRLDQVIGNLVANALRHTPRDGIVTLQAASHPEDVQITVSDTGEGIAPEQLPHIFDRFWSRSEGGGSGLGLAIARSLVHAHGGRIEAASQPGEGTTISVYLPSRRGTVEAQLAIGG